MNIANFILLLLLSLLAAPVLAQESNVHDKEKRSGMSYQDYINQREKLLKRMNSQQAQQAPEQERNANGESAHDSKYGQGYESRKGAKHAAENKPDVGKGSRPERPHFERPGRP